MLQIFALELRAQGKSPNFSPTKMKDLLDLLFSTSSGNGAAGERGIFSGCNNPSSGDMPMMTTLRMAVDLPVLSLPSIVSPIIIRCLQAATVPYTVSRGGRVSSAGKIYIIC